MRCLYLAPSGELGVVYDSRLESTSERHKMGLAVEPYDAEGHPLRILERDPTLDGLILEMYLGWVGRDRLLIARSALVRGRRVWLMELQLHIGPAHQDCRQVVGTLPADFDRGVGDRDSLIGQSQGRL